jgi:hypothetical protein
MAISLLSIPHGCRDAGTIIRQLIALPRLSRPNLSAEGLNYPLVSAQNDETQLLMAPFVRRPTQLMST